MFAVFAALALSAYKPKKPATPPPPPAPPAPVIPPRPYPPLNSSPNLVLPALGVNGMYANLNSANTASQNTWNFRSAYNVAALNCLQPQHAQIVVNYRAFLRKHAVGLTAANRGVDADFRKRHGAGYVRQRESFMTKVYNFYAFPPTVQYFCDAALAVSNEANAIPPAQLGSFAATALPRFDMVFENFYRSYAQYRTDLAAWDARYGRPVAPQLVTQPAPPPARAQ
jgi:hypothetical protein